MSFPLLNKAIVENNDLAIEKARRNLNLTGFAGKKGRKTNNTKKLSKGLGYTMKISNDQIVTEYTTKEDYGIFIEHGVNGYVKSVGGKYKFKKKMANVAAIEKYVRSGKIKLRKTFINKHGQKVSKFVPKTDKNIKSAAFAMAKSIARNGIKPTHFMKEGVKEAIKSLPKNAEIALASDMANLLVKKMQGRKNVTVIKK